MVKINYFKDKPFVFMLDFKLRDYIPAKYFKSEVDFFAEICFFIDLLRDNEILKSTGTPRVWNIEFDCVYDETPFKMVFDDDYGFVHFAVECVEAKVKIAEALKHLMENRSVIGDGEV